MWSAPRSRTSAALLLVLCSGLLVSAEPNSGSGPASQQASLVGILDQLWSFIERAQTSVGRSVLAQVETRLEEVERRLSGPIAELNVSTSARDTELESRLSALDTELESRLSAHDTELDSRLSARDTELDSRLTALDEKLSASDSMLDSRRSAQITELSASLTARDTELESSLSTLDTELNSRLMVLDDKLNASLSTRDTGLDTSLSIMDTKLDSRLSALDTRLSALDTELSSRLSTQLSELSDRLDRHIEAQGNNSRRYPKAAPPRDCSDLPAGSPSGVYLLKPGLDRKSLVPAFCDLETDGGNWTVLQRRADIEPREDFYRGWDAYREGFGELDGEFWWGLENMWTVTAPRDRQYELRIDLGHFEGEQRHAIYQKFRISSESDGYRLSLVNYTGDAEDGLAYHVGRRFSTKDRDQDSSSSNCAQSYEGAWWFGKCHYSNLNGRYIASGRAKPGHGVNWELWKGVEYPMRSASMKIRPTRKALNE